VTGLATTLFAVSCLAALPSCAADPPKAGPEHPPQATLKSSVELYFPLEEGKIYNYATRDGTESGMLVAKVHRTDSSRGELRLSNATKRFSYTPDTVGYEGGATILKAPLEVGSTWPGEHGGTTKIASTDTSVEVLAGSYTGCIQTVEDGGRIKGARYETTYCPGVGMVLLVVTAPGSDARAELKSYGMPVKIE
jgi:hypothetical protein